MVKFSALFLLLFCSPVVGWQLYSQTVDDDLLTDDRSHLDSALTNSFTLGVSWDSAVREDLAYTVELQQRIYDARRNGHRPIAGILLLSGQVSQPWQSVQLQLGYAGPDTFAEDIQNGWHKTRSLNRVNHWPDQISHEVLANLNGVKKWPFADNSLSVEVFGQLGNLRTAAGAGAEFRIGSAKHCVYGASSYEHLSGTNSDCSGWLVTTHINVQFVSHDFVYDTDGRGYKATGSESSVVQGIFSAQWHHRHGWIDLSFRRTSERIPNLPFSEQYGAVTFGFKL